jgi:hypothetical protein
MNNEVKRYSRNLNRSINHWNSLRPVSMSEPKITSFALSNKPADENREAKNEKPMMRVKLDMPSKDDVGSSASYISRGSMDGGWCGPCG